MKSKRVKGFLVALQFLTVIPINIKPEIKDEDLGASVLYFPLVGLMIGLLLAASNFLFSFLPILTKGALVLILLIVITGGIHLDGFADTCDGLYAGQSKEKVLEIMRDSHIGAMGVVGILCILLLKFALIVSFTEGLLWRVLILMPVFARLSQVFACTSSFYVRSNGKAKYFIEYANKSNLFFGTLFTVSLFFLLMRIKGIILFFSSALIIFMIFHYIKKRIGGMTGDTIGALNEFSEVIILLFCLFYQAI